MYNLIIRIETPALPYSKSLSGYRNFLDITYDKYGFPFIPSSQLKGYLRNACKELKGFCPHLHEDEIFGRPNDNRGALIISDAKLLHYQDLRSAIVNESLNKVHLPLNKRTLLDYYTHRRLIRSRHHFTDARTINPGLEFVAPFKIDKKYFKYFKTIALSLKAIGKYKSRGLGEISCRIEEAPVYKNKSNAVFNSHLNYVRMNIRLTNISRLCIRDTFDELNLSRHYIPGSLILGYLHSKLGKTINNVKCSNCYIEINKKRSYPVAATFFYKKINEKILCDKLSPGRRENDTDQLCRLGPRYLSSLVDDKILFTEVDNTNTNHYMVNYHAKNRQYFVNALDSDQTFSGFIEGDKNNLKLIYQELVKNPEISIGSFITRGFGRCHVDIVNLEVNKKDKDELASEFVLYLNAPTLIRNDNGLCTTRVIDFTNVVSKIIGEPLVCVDTFQNCIKIANYNYLAKEIRPQIYCIDKGAIYLFRTKNGKKINLSRFKKMWIGELNNVGFGEAFVYQPCGNYYRELIPYTKDQTVEKTNDNQYGNALLNNIARFFVNQIFLLVNAPDLIDEKEEKLSKQHITYSDRFFEQVYKKIIVYDIGKRLKHKL